MRFPIIKQEDQSLVLEVPDELLQQLQQLTSPNSSQADAQLKESQDKVGELQEKVAEAEGRTMADFTPEEKAGFVLTWARGLSLEDKAIFAEAVGIPMAATDAEVAEAEEEPKIIQRKTDKPGYKYLEMLNLSVRE